MNRQQDTIAALCTPPGSGALGVIRISGPQAVAVADRLFSRSLADAPGHSLHYGQFRRPDGSPLDDVLLSVFRAPRSFTREETVEISFHGSPYILREALEVLTGSGCRLAEPGEFTRRAWLNGAFDLAQAEAIADLIAAESAAQHRVALNQLRGGVSRELAALREELLHFASLIELELDFAEEDVEFADRSGLQRTVDRIQAHIGKLAHTFKLGNAVKNGIPTVIVGRPNAGKSTLLNALLQEERAIVSPVAGTTRDTIEETLNINGVMFRLVDTAGIRDAQDQIEVLGIRRTMEKIESAAILVYVFDVTALSVDDVRADILSLLRPGMSLVVVANKIDLAPQFDRGFWVLPQVMNDPQLFLSAKNPDSIHELLDTLYGVALGNETLTDAPVVTSARHAEALARAAEALAQVQTGLQTGISGDFLALDIRAAMFHIGSITGQITNDDILGNIFSKFCIGK